MIIGLDCSTKCCGFCILNDNGNYKDIGYIDLSKEKNLYSKLDLINKNLPITSNSKIFIEAPLQRSNNQNVVNLLQRFNGMVCSMIYCNYGIKPILIDHRAARKENGIKIPKGVKGKETKKYIFEFVKKLGIIPEEKWEYKKTGNPKEQMYDIVDAYVVVKAGSLTNNEQ